MQLKLEEAQLDHAFTPYGEAVLGASSWCYHPARETPRASPSLDRGAGSLPPQRHGHGACFAGSDGVTLLIHAEHKQEKAQILFGSPKVK